MYCINRMERPSKGVGKKAIVLFVLALLLSHMFLGSLSACDIISVDLYAGHYTTDASEQNHAPGNWLYEKVNGVVYFYAECNAEAGNSDDDSEDIRWRFYFDDGSSKTLYTINSESSGTKTMTTLYDDYDETGEYRPNVAVDRGKRTGTYPDYTWTSASPGATATDICRVNIFDVDITTPSSFPEDVCVEDDLSLGSTVEPTGTESAGTFSWSKASGPGTGTVTFTSSSSEDPTFSADESGTYTAKVNFSIDDSPGDCTEDPITVSDTSGNIIVVGVDSISILDDGDYDDVTGQSIVVLKGSKYTFKAFRTPTSVPWPGGSPVWSGAASGTGETTEVTFNTEGTQTVTAKCCCGTGKSVTVKVIVPQPYTVSFIDNVAGEEHDITDVTDPVWKWFGNPFDPAAYTMGKKVKLRPTFWHADSLTYDTDVHIDVEGDDDGTSLTFAQDTSMEFGTSWPSAELHDEHVSDSALDDSIGTNEVVFTFKYKVPSGSNTWITMTYTTTTIRIYRVYGNPKCYASVYTADHLEHATEWADGGVNVTEDDIPKKIQENCWHGFEFRYLPDPWDLETENGDCRTHARLMAEALQVLGINADGYVKVGETRWCTEQEMEEHHVFVTVGGEQTNWEGVCEVNLIDESTPWKCYYDVAMQEVGSDPAFQKGSQTNMWTEWNNYPPPNHKVIHHFVFWSNHP